MVASERPGAAHRLRFDTVALRVVRGVRGASEGDVPEGWAVVFSVTAPIREPGKTMVALAGVVRAALLAGAGAGNHVEVVCGNQVWVRVLSRRLPGGARVAGFVHSAGSPPIALLDLVQSLLEGMGAEGMARSGGIVPDLQTLRRVCGQLFDDGECANVVAGFGGGR